VDPIPDWVTELVVKPLEDCGLIQKVKVVFFLSGSVVNPNSIGPVELGLNQESSGRPILAYEIAKG